MQIHSTITRALSLATLLIASVVTEAEACKQGYVWREAAGPNDIVCVTPVERSISAVQIQAYPNESCAFGLLWREATQGDHRCVTPEERTVAAVQNQAVRDRN